MTEQTELFDAEKAEDLKREGMGLAADNRSECLARAREGLKTLNPETLEPHDVENATAGRKENSDD